MEHIADIIPRTQAYKLLQPRTVTVDLTCQACQATIRHTYNGTDLLLTHAIRCTCGSGRFEWRKTRKAA